MFNTLLTRIVGSKNERELKKLRPIVEQINELEPSVRALSDEELRGRTGLFRQRLEQGATLDDLLPEAFAVAREAGLRTLGQRAFDVQLIGGVVLHQGKVAEMKTGEGKTLTATLPVYLNSLAGQGVHVVTVNDYLARRDSVWMGRIYRALGLTVGVIQHDMDDADRRAAYRADVTYGTNNEFGFDYLRDNGKLRLEDMCQRGHQFAIVDEVDSILIDEARTPLIISGPSEDRTDTFFSVDKVIPKLKPEIHYQVDEKHRTATFTEEGVERIEQILNLDNLYDPAHMDLVHQLYNALKAHTLFKRDVDYMVKDGQVVIVDEFTGRLMPGRRWSDGLHQAVEAKERVKIERETQTYATVTFQNYFRMYDKLAGMTGTADTEAAEFSKTYNLDVVVIPPNRQLIRLEYPDVVYRTAREKFEAIAREVIIMHAQGRPVLVGTISIEKSERLGEMLGRLRKLISTRPGWLTQILLDGGVVPEEKASALEAAVDDKRARDVIGRPARLKDLLSELGLELGAAAHRLTEVLESGRIQHVVLNAKHHEREAEIVAQAGRLGAVTIATNMAGRGTDILLGGNPEFLARSELGSEAEIAQPELYRQAVERYREQCRAEHDEVVSHGGLHIVASERHESRRIDNQLRGRSGRQGDPGSSRFYLSLEDDLMRIFGSDRIGGIMQKLGMEEGEPIEHGMVTRAIERAQKQIEAQNFETRKHLLEYDDVLNKQREAYYGLRRDILETDDIREYVLDVASEQLDETVRELLPENPDEREAAFDDLKARVLELFGLDISSQREELVELPGEEVRDKLFRAIEQKYVRKEAELGPELMNRWSRDMMLHVGDSAWKDHLYSMDHLKEGIGLRGYGQRDPLVEYKRESYNTFQAMWTQVQTGMLRSIFLYRPVVREEPRPAPRQDLKMSGAGDMEDKPIVTVRKKGPKIGRNSPCPCGSGKKYKKCCGS